MTIEITKVKIQLLVTDNEGEHMVQLLAYCVNYQLGPKHNIQPVSGILPVERFFYVHAVINQSPQMLTA